MKHFASFDGFQLSGSQRCLLQDDGIYCSSTLSEIALIIPPAVILELFIYKMKLTYYQNDKINI